MYLVKNNKFLKRFISFSMVLIMLLGLALTQNIFALNNISSKASNFSGYRILNDHSIEIWIDKGGGTTPEISQFKILEGTENGGNQIPILSVSNGSDKNVSGIVGKIPQGKSYILTTYSGSFKAGENYLLIINNTVATGSNTLGWFTSHKDIQFVFSIPETTSIPNSNSSYLSSTAPTSNSWPENNATNVAVESNIWLSTSIPVANYNEVKAGLLLKKNGVSVKYDDYLYTGVVSTGNNDADIFSPVVTDDHTFFYFPLTVGGRDTSIYNLQADAQYELVVPEIKLINGQIIPRHSINFHTAGSTVATQFNSSPSVSEEGDNLRIRWTTPNRVDNTSPAPIAYNLYASTEKYWNYVKINTTPIKDTSFITSNCNLLPNTAYYFRVSALSNENILNGESYGVIESGFSDAVTGRTPADVEAPVWPSNSNIKALDVKQNSLLLSWSQANDSTGVKYYRIYKDDLLIDTVNSDTTNYNITGLEEGSEYTFKIQAADGANNWSTNGPSINVKTLSKDVSIPEKIMIYSDNDTLEVGSIPVSETFTSKVYDEKNVEMNGQKVNWSVVKNLIGVTISDEGVLTVKPFASIGTITVKGTIEGTSLSITKQIKLKTHVFENPISKEQITKEIDSSSESNVISLSEITGDSIAIDNEAIQLINTADKPLMIKVNNTKFQFKLSEVNLNGESIDNVKQLQIRTLPVDEYTKNELDTDSSIDNLLGGTYKMITTPFKLNVIAILKNGEVQEIRFNHPVKISILSPLGLNLSNNQTLRICRFNTETGKWEDKGSAKLNNLMIDFNTSSFSYWTAMIKTASSIGNQTDGNEIEDNIVEDTGGNTQTGGNLGTNTKGETKVNTEENSVIQTQGSESEELSNNIILTSLRNVASQTVVVKNSNSSENNSDTTTQKDEAELASSDGNSAKVDDNKKESDANTSKNLPSDDKQNEKIVKEHLLDKIAPISWIAIIISLVLIYRIVFVILKSRKKIDKNSTN